jgi:3-isopropylmalate/(R)-2-methylmalate dehydratase large subunit
VNPDATTFEYLRGRRYAPEGEAFDRAVRWWSQMASDPDAAYADHVEIDGSALAPTITWGINPGQAVGIDEGVPRLEELDPHDRATAEEAFAHMDLRPGQSVQGIPIDVAFVGSCTNSRISDLREAAAVARGRRVDPGVRALVVPGSEQVKLQAEDEGLDKIFAEAGFQWREAGCSMCLAMNPDKLVGRELCASSSNRNFKGRQGSATGRTLLMSPAMVVAAAVNGCVTDVRELLA